MAGNVPRVSRRWCFTLNNWTPDEFEAIRAAMESGACRYGIVGREVAESGTPHLQGYVEFSTTQRLSAVKRLLCADRLHGEISRGTGREASEYCKKEGDFLEFGRLGGGQGARNDLLEVKSMLDVGSSMLDVASEHFQQYCRYRKAFECYAALKIPVRSWRTQVIWFWGRTRSGKSRLAHAESQALCGGDVAWLADTTCQWFEPYRGNKGVIMDDMDGRAPISYLLRIFDRYEMLVPVKGGFVQWSPRIVWCTSNHSPEVLYGHCGEHYAALLARIDEIKEFN